MLANESNCKGDTKRKQALDAWNYVLNTWYWKTEPEVMRRLPLMPWGSQKISRLETAREKKHCTTKAGWSTASEWILLVLFSQTGMMRLHGTQWGRHWGVCQAALARMEQRKDFWMVLFALWNGGWTWHRRSWQTSMEMSEIQHASRQRLAGLAALMGTDHSQHPHESQAVNPGCTEVVKDQEDTVRTSSNSHCWSGWGWMVFVVTPQRHQRSHSALGTALCIWLMVIPTCVLGWGNYRMSSTHPYWWPWNAMCQEMHSPITNAD